MINNLNDFWNQVFERLVTVNGDHNLEELFSKFEDATLRDIVEDDEIINTAFTAFKEIISNTLPFLAQYQSLVPVVPLEDNHVQITATVIKTVLSKREVDSVSMEDTFRQMAALFVVISALGLDRNGFPENIKGVVNDNFLKASVNVLRCYSFKLRSKNALTTDWKKLKDLYEEGLVEQNFKKSILLSVRFVEEEVCLRPNLFVDVHDFWLEVIHDNQL